MRIVVTDGVVVCTSAVVAGTVPVAVVCSAAVTSTGAVVSSSNDDALDSISGLKKLKKECRKSTENKKITIKLSTKIENLSSLDF